MKKIPLTRGQFAIVDDSDYEWLMQWKWHAIPQSPTGGFYASRAGSRTEKPRKHTAMHRAILGINSKTKVDHKDGDGLNNQRQNIRVATTSQNGGNRRKQAKPTSSKFKGVCWHKRDKVWQVMIMANGKYTYVGFFQSEVEAAMAYNKAATSLFGEFAHLNEV